MFAVSFIPIFLGAGAAGLISWAWYHPTIFGASWAHMSGLSPEMLELSKRNMPFMAFYAFLAAVIMAYVLSYFAMAWQVFDWPGAIELAFWVWLGFVCPALLGSVLWEQRPFKLFLINTGYWLTTLIVMSLIIVTNSQIAAGARQAQQIQADAIPYQVQY